MRKSLVWSGIPLVVTLTSVAASPQILTPNLLYTPMQPCRLVDTRVSGGALTPGIPRQIDVQGVTAPGSLSSQGGNPNGCPIPGLDPTFLRSQVQAVMLNFVAVGATGAGDLRAWPTGQAAPTASVVNFARQGSLAGLNIANGIALSIEQDVSTGDLTVLADVSGTHLVVDVVGYFSSSAAVAGGAAFSLFLGRGAGNQSTSSGEGNTALGTFSLSALTSGDSNTGVGWGSLATNTTGASNTAVGASALNGIGAGSAGFNTAIGVNALDHLSTGSQNIGVGFGAGANLSTGNSNIDIASNPGADESNTIRIGTPGTGFGQQNRAFVAGVNGVSLPTNPGFVLIDPVSNQLGATPAFGASFSGSAANALSFNGSNTIGTWLNLQNSASGLTWSLISTGSGNGEGAGRLLIHSSTGGDSVNIDGTNNVTLPSLASGGTSGVSATSTGTLILTPSDARLKKAVVDLPKEIDVLATLAQLRGVAFDWDTSIAKARDLGSEREIGMIAQEVERVLPQVVRTGVDGYKTLDYAKLVAVLVEVAKLQQSRLETLEAELDTLRQTVESLRPPTPR